MRRRRDDPVTRGLTGLAASVRQRRTRRRQLAVAMSALYIVWFVVSFTVSNTATKGALLAVWTVLVLATGAAFAARRAADDKALSAAVASVRGPADVPLLIECRAVLDKPADRATIEARLADLIPAMSGRRGCAPGVALRPDRADGGAHRDQQGDAVQKRARRPHRAARHAGASRALAIAARGGGAGRAHARCRGPQGRRPVSRTLAAGRGGRRAQRHPPASGRCPIRWRAAAARGAGRRRATAAAERGAELGAPPRATPAAPPSVGQAAGAPRR